MRKAIVLLWASVAFGQEFVIPETPLKSEIAPGTTRRLVLNCEAGDYVGAAITRQGTINVTILGPDGVPLRRFRHPGVDGVRRIGFAADAPGRYTIDLSNPSQNNATFELRVDRILPLAERLTLTPGSETYQSPDIRALRKQVSSQAAGATAQFWQDVRKTGSPLVEPDGANGKYHLVTFLWRAESLTRNVVVVGPSWGSLSHADNAMRNIPGTDVWYLTKRLPTGARFDYRLSVNDPLTSDDRGAAIRRSTVRPDPLNSKIRGLSAERSA